MIVRIAVFAAAGLLILMKFRRHLFLFNTHAPYVFVAFQLILALMFLNMPLVFEGPLRRWPQALSWLLLITSAAFAVGGFAAIKRYGKAEGDWEATTDLVKRGVFRYIRHPLYSSLMQLSVGFLLQDMNWLSFTLCLFSLVFLAAASLVEEKENIDKFGGLYRAYAAETRLYVPFIL
jgi:protein-S-isoprenylcysteine O-methyltransferase Ste14